MRNPSNSRIYRNDVHNDDWKRHFIILEISSLDLIQKIKNYFGGKNTFPNREMAKTISLLDEVSQSMAAEIILSRCQDLPDQQLSIIKTVINRYSNLEIIQNEKNEH